MDTFEDAVALGETLLHGGLQPRHHFVGARRLELLKPRCEFAQPRNYVFAPGNKLLGYCLTRSGIHACGVAPRSGGVKGVLRIRPSRSLVSTVPALVKLALDFLVALWTRPGSRGLLRRFQCLLNNLLRFFDPGFVEHP